SAQIQILAFSQGRTEALNSQPIFRHRSTELLPNIEFDHIVRSRNEDPYSRTISGMAKRIEKHLLEELHSLKLGEQHPDVVIKLIEAHIEEHIQRFILAGNFFMAILLVIMIVLGVLSWKIDGVGRKSTKNTENIEHLGKAFEQVDIEELRSEVSHLRDRQETSDEMPEDDVEDVEGLGGYGAVGKWLRSVTGTGSCYYV
ncbi:hypothetical protein BJ875DRAFT_513958, partial [Amylocarpus encephaloides]